MKLSKTLPKLTKNPFIFIGLIVLIIYVSNLLFRPEGFRGHHPVPHPRHYPHHYPHRRPHYRPHYGPQLRPQNRRWWDFLTFTWVPGLIGTCKSGCSYLGKGSWGCTYPGQGPNDCLFASDCRWCGSH